MKELSIFVDESGSDDLACAHYLVALLLHDQDDHIAESISKYENSLVASGLPDIPFHAEPLMNGHGRYSGLSLETRARLFTSFRVFFAICQSAMRSWRLRRKSMKAWMS